eukprot:5099963-Amphidinium_carterae.1
MEQRPRSEITSMSCHAIGAFNPKLQPSRTVNLAAKPSACLHSLARWEQLHGFGFAYRMQASLHGKNHKR